MLFCLTMSRLGLFEYAANALLQHTLSWRRHGECPGAIALPRSILNSCFCTHSSPFPAEHRTGNLVPLCTAKFGSQIETQNGKGNRQLRSRPALRVAWKARIRAGLWFSNGNCSFTILSTYQQTSPAGHQLPRSRCGPTKKHLG